MKIDISMFGDMAIRDLSPKDANSSGRIIKNLRICGSGLYEYHISEAPLMGLVVPSDYHGDTFKIYRSAEVLEQNKELYARVPIITGHHVRVNTANAKQLAVGMVGDTVQSEVGEDGETYLYTTGTIITGDGIAAYEKYGELSVGYDPIVEWREGEYKGQKYQAVLKGFNEINHLLICETARGGHQCMIMDSLPSLLDKAKKADIKSDNDIKGGKKVGFFNKIFGKSEPKTIPGDSLLKTRTVSALLQSVKAGADCKTQVTLAKDIMGASADATLNDYFEDLLGDSVKDADKETLGKALDIVDAYCAKLLGDEKPEEKKSEGDVQSKDAQKAEGDEKPEEKKSEGDEKLKAESCDDPSKCSGDAIDLDKLATLVADKLSARQAESSKAQESVAGDSMEPSRMAALLNNTDVADNSLSSDSLMKALWG